MKLRHISFYHGHKGAVLSLAGSVKQNFFFSVGAEGLIVRWSLKVPDEGQVLLRLPGIVPSLVYDPVNKLLYATLNQKGVVVIESATGKIVNKIPVPSTSFGKIKLTDEYIVLTSKKGEVILVERATLKIAERIETGIDRPPPMAFNKRKNELWYYTSAGLCKLDLETFNEEKGIVHQPTPEIFDLKIMNSSMLVLGATSVHTKNLKKSRSEWLGNQIKEDSFLYMLGNEGAPAILTVSEKGMLWGFKEDKKGLTEVMKVQNIHNGTINDLLWSENHKFVLSAGSDKTIGVWRTN